jgi:hypothetical protein
MDPADLWAFLPFGYLFTILVETPVLLLLLARRHPVRHRLLAGVWLTACTYPVVVLVLPLLFADRTTYLLVAETFAPAAECVLFLLAFGRATWIRDCLAITVANLLSFGLGEWVLN